ncbi:site-specific integrase [Acidiferrobacter sp.]|uniref:integrase n=1 Tax=Acidiferrobacter sp. TaxID=1872107 RepID=UPI0026266F48|nr:site-specific integrase [Acidiferrobacter sp.]
MATFLHRPGRSRRGAWQAKIRRRGYPQQTATFDSRAQAEAWARQIESEMDRGVFVSRVEAENTTLRDALDRYAREISNQKKTADREIYTIRWWQSSALGARPLASIRGKDITVALSKKAGEGAAANTIHLYLALLSNLFNVARRQWGMEGLTNPTEFVQKPKLPSGRDRRLEGDEEARLLKGAGAGFAPIIRWALATAMRRGEIAGLRWEHIDRGKRSAFLPETKNGFARSVPLSSAALAVLDSLPHCNDGSVFGMTENAITLAMKRACAKAKIAGLTFHDLRHEAVSRLFENTDLDAMEIARISGHRTLSMLSRYTHLRAHRLAERLDGAKRGTARKTKPRAGWD